MALAAASSLLALAPAALATDFVVNSTADPATPDNSCTPNPGGCTLRDAVDDAGANDTVIVPANTYVLTQGPLRPSGERIAGAGARSTIINGGGVGSVFVVVSPGNRISGLTLTNGGGQNQEGVGGGGIFILAAATAAGVTVTDSTIAGNSAQSGGGIANNGGTLTLVRSTVSGNTAFATSVGTQGGGIAIANGTTQIVNSTISGNTADSDESASPGGGIYFNGTGSLAIENSTITGNRAPRGSGVSLNGTATMAVSHTIIARNLFVNGTPGVACENDFTQLAADHDLVDDNTCGFAATIANPLLGPLANNGGPTNTHAIGSTSPAVNHGAATCQPTDQRGVARPQGSACDIGAYEYRAPRLTLVTRVVNDQGGTQAPGDFAVHLRSGGSEVVGSPAPGTAAGRTYTLVPGSYAVSETSDSRYTAAISGNCAANGVVTLTEGQSKICAITNNDKPPVAGKVINGVPKSGTVKVKFPGGKFHRLREGEQLPNGTIVDTRKGRITLFAAANKSGGLAKADFFDGLFKLTQSKGKKPLTTLTLTEKLSCKGSAKKASAAKKKKKKRRLWGDGKGRFRTKGSFSSATVRGTRWLVEDRCTSTLTRVKRGKVAVRDFVKHKTVLVKKNHKYVAHKRR